MQYATFTGHGVLGTCNVRVYAGLQVVLHIFFHVFRDENGKLDTKALHSAMYSKYQHTSFSTASSPDMFKCLLECVNPVQP